MNCKRPLPAKGAVVGERNFFLCNANDGRIDVIEGFFVDAAYDFRTDTVRLPAFFDDDGAVGFLEGIEHGFHIERAQGAQVYDLSFDALLAEFVGGFHRKLKTLAIGDDGEVFAFALYFGFSDRDGVFALGHFAADLIHGGVFDEENRIIRTDG